MSLLIIQGTSDQVMDCFLKAKITVLFVDNFVNSSLLPSIIASNTIILSHQKFNPNLIKGSLTATASEEPPGGWDNWEFVTDITASFLGFGVFMVSACSSFTQFSDLDSQGWQYKRNGYLSEAEHCVALGLFLELKGLSFDDVSAHLKPSLSKLLKKALREIRERDVIQELKSIE